MLELREYMDINEMTVKSLSLFFFFWVVRDDNSRTGQLDRQRRITHYIYNEISSCNVIQF